MNLPIGAGWPLALLSALAGMGVLAASIPARAQVRSTTETYEVEQSGRAGVSRTGRSDISMTRRTDSETSALDQSRIVSDPTTYQPDEIVGEVSQTGTTPGHDRVAEQSRAELGLRTASRVRPAKPSEYETFVSNLVGYEVRRFGAELLVPAARDFTAPPTIAIPPDYRINPGDELVVGLTGSVQASNLRLTVDQDGRIFIPKVGAIRVAGVPFRDLQGAIAAQVARQYRDFRVSVSIGELHGITVYVTGFAAAPGSYTISSLSTLVNAVLAAGGPAAGGSFRSIQVRRGGRLVSDFDLYDFLLKGDKRNDIVLENGDVITIAPSGAQVAAIGSVNREAIYEARNGDTLNDVLLYAGGANTVADLSRLHVFDPKADNGWQELAPEAALARNAERGAVLRVISAVGMSQPSQRLQSLVTISGEVARPGRYFVKPGTTLDEVVALAGGLTPEAYSYGAVFVRDRLRREQKLNFERAINETRIALTASPLVSASPEQQADLTSRVAAVDALVEQLRSRRIDGRVVLEVAPDSRAIPGSFVVENNDELFVPPRSLAVGVYGMVNSSANFRYAPGLTIRDYLKRAGGFSKIADKRHIFVVRANGTIEGGRAVAGKPALPGDLVFVPVDSERGAFWARLRDLVGLGLQGALTTAAVISASK
jgi:polysaccharide biosynthesis/export protein